MRAGPSAWIGVVDVQELRTFLRFLRCARGPLRVVGVQKLRTVFTISEVRERPLAWSMCKKCDFFAISDARARPSAWIGVVDVQELKTFLRILRFARDPLRRCVSKGSCCGLARIRLCVGTLCRRSCVSKRSRCGAVRFSC